MKFHKMKAVDQDVVTLARERLAYVYDRYDVVAVSFSGGKDSTCCLNLAIEAATACGRLPVDVFSFDEECIPPETVDYMARVAARGEVRFNWYCVPIRHRNACSTDVPYWFPWAEEDRAKWVRPLPPQAITSYPGMTRGDIAAQVSALFPPSRGTVANVMGIRTQESMTRYRTVASKTGHRAYLTPLSVAKHVMNVYPIYDWATADVWRAPARFGWDYNRAYDVMDAAGISHHLQRCAPPFGEQPIRGLHKFKTCWPELWGKMVDRVPGAATAARYANTELYGCSVSDEDLPHGLTWRDWTMQTLRALKPDSRAEAAQAIADCMTVHKSRAGSRPVPDDQPDPLSGYSWKILFTAAKTGGNKFNRIGQKMMSRALAERARRGITS